MFGIQARESLPRTKDFDPVEHLEAVNARSEERDARFVEIEDRIAGRASRVAAETFWLLRDVAELDEKDLVAAPDTIEEWVAWRCSMTVAEAKTLVRVGRALRDLPLISAALESGELSYTKAGFLTKIATPETEETLLTWARNGTAAQLRRIVTSYLGALEGSDLDLVNRRYAERFLRHGFNERGDFVLNGRLTPEDGILVAQAIEAAMNADSDEGEGFDQRRADALVTIAQTALDADSDATPSHRDRYQAVIHVGVDALTGDDPTARCELFPDISLHPETARRLTCDSPIVGLVEKDGEPLDIGRKTRSLSSAIRRALMARDRGCRWPGCTNKRWIDGHHMEHWGRGGETKLINLCSLCRKHHRMVHEGEIAVRLRTDGEFEFVHPGGWLIVASPPIGPPLTDPDPPNTATMPRTHVDDCDYGLAVECLLQSSGAA